MRVGLIFSGCHPRGGVERVVWEAANFLAGAHEVTVIAGEADPLSENVAVELVRASGAFRRDARQVLLDHEFDVTVSFGSNCPVGDVLVVGSVHRAWVDRGTSVRMGPISVPGAARRLMPRHRAMLRGERNWFGESAGASVVAVSDGVAADLQHYYGIEESRISVIPNGFSPTQCSDRRRQTLRPEWRERLGIGDDEVALLLIANEWHRKGLGVILNAMARIDDPRMRLLLVGRQEPAAYVKQIKRLGLQDRVKWFGVAHDVAEYHAAADLFVMPTVYEPFGSVIVEALGSGLPVITSAVAGAAIAVHEDRNGLLLSDPTSDAELAALLEHAIGPGVLERWSAMAAASVADFKWSRVMERFEGVLRDHVAARR